MSSLPVLGIQVQLAEYGSPNERFLARALLDEITFLPICCMKPTALDRLLDIEKAIEQIEEFCAEHTEESFLDDERDQSAVCWQLLAIGEAAAKLPS